MSAGQAQQHKLLLKNTDVSLNISSHYSLYNQKGLKNKQD